MPRNTLNTPSDIDSASAPPKGYEHYVDPSGKDPIEWAKDVVHANYPAIKNIQLFREPNTVGGPMKARFTYHGIPKEINIPYEKALNTLTPQSFKDLAPHLQRMTPLERGVFNTILQEVKKMRIAEIQ